MREVLSGSIVDSINDFFKITLSLNPEVKVFDEIPEGGIDNEYIASIGLAGAVEGSCVVCIKKTSAQTIISKMLFCELDEIVDEGITDGLGEIVNIVAGGVKMRLASQNYDFNISIPTVVEGTPPLILARPKGSDVLKIDVRCEDCSMDLYLFYLENVSRKPEGLKESNVEDESSESSLFEEDAGSLLKGLIGE